MLDIQGKRQTQTKITYHFSNLLNILKKIDSKKMKCICLHLLKLSFINITIHNQEVGILQLCDIIIILDD